MIDIYNLESLLKSESTKRFQEKVDSRLTDILKTFIDESSSDMFQGGFYSKEFLRTVYRITKEDTHFFTSDELERVYSYSDRLVAILEKEECSDSTKDIVKIYYERARCKIALLLARSSEQSLLWLEKSLVSAKNLISILEKEKINKKQLQLFEAECEASFICRLLYTKTKKAEYGMNASQYSIDSFRTGYELSKKITRNHMLISQVKGSIKNSVISGAVFAVDSKNENILTDIIENVTKIVSLDSSFRKDAYFIFAQTFIEAIQHKNKSFYAKLIYKYEELALTDKECSFVLFDCIGLFYRKVRADEKTLFSHFLSVAENLSGEDRKNIEIKASQVSFEKIKSDSSLQEKYIFLVKGLGDFYVDKKPSFACDSYLKAARALFFKYNESSKEDGDSLILLEARSSAECVKKIAPTIALRDQAERFIDRIDLQVGKSKQQSL